VKEAEKVRAAGFTLVEMLVTTVLFGVVMVYLMGTFTVSHKQQANLEQVVEAQGNLRAISDLMERDARHAGLMVPLAGSICGVDSTTGPDILYVSDAEAIEPAALTTGELGSEIGQTNIASGDSLAIDLVLEPDPDAAYDTDGDGTADSDFQLNGGVIFVDTEDPDRGTACGRVSALTVLGGKIGVTLASDSLAASGGGTSKVVAIPAIEYRVDANNQLLRNGRVLAQGVEDLQVAYFFDLDDDGELDAGEYLGDGTSPDYTAKGRDASLAREIRVSFVVRTRIPDVDMKTGLAPAVENHPVAIVSDGFRRRVQTSNAMLRNVVTRSPGGA